MRHPVEDVPERNERTLQVVPESGNHGSESGCNINKFAVFPIVFDADFVLSTISPVIS